MKTLTITTIAILLLSVICCHAEDRYEVGEFGQHVTTADFNNDGYIDFCVNNYYGSSISVLLNNGDGKYALPVSYPTAKYPRKVTVGDVNNDGCLDMLFTHNLANSVMYIYFNKGDGSFHEPAIYELDVNYGADEHPLTVADLNNDGWLDILSSMRTQHLLMIMINNGDGTFPEHFMIDLSIISTIDQVDSPYVADADNDGFLDVFVSYYKAYGPSSEPGGFIAFLRNKGDGTFFDPVTYVTPSTQSRLTLVDVDNNGFVDVLCTNPKTDNISLFYNNKDGTFSEPVSIDTGTYPQRATLADIDKDGWIDLLVSNLNSQNLSIFLNNGDGTFKDPYSYITGIRPREVTASDLNNDGWIDMTVSCHPYLPSANYILIFLNNRDGTFTESGRYGKGKRFVDEAEIVNVNNDEWVDLIQSDQGVKNINCIISVFRNIGNGKFDNSGIDLRHDPDTSISAGKNVKIIFDLRTFPRSVNADLYFVMLNPAGIIYSSFAWNEGIAPALRDLPLPPNTNLFDFTLCEFTIPSQKPPVSALGSYTFAMGLFKPNTDEMLTNLTTTTIEVTQ